MRDSLRSGTCLIGRLVVHLHYQGTGIGTTLMKSLEKAFSEADRLSSLPATRA
ncbi:GNAT family N-acetyltransferase [Syntrophus sp. (in: bacteria)]|uniref:GNAT family N-acetyltransferase n=1 Tax=Syntrophus sp. (in: bacteria) TaxID=48412 RepID=UPI00345E4A9C